MLQDKFIKGSLVLFAATMVLNLSNYVFHVLMGRFLGPESYGILGVLLSLLYLISIPTQVIQFSLSKFISEFKAGKKADKINVLFRRSYRKLFFIGLILMGLMIISVPLLSSFLKIPEIYLFLLAPAALLTFIIPINRGFMQGLQKFISLGTNLTVEGLSKLLFGILFVYIGFNVGGAVLALLFSLLLAIIFGIFPLKSFLENKKEEIESKLIYKYSLPVLFSLIFLTGLYTIDIFFVKHFFDSLQAGYYVAASLLGKIILFISMSVVSVMFPQSVEAFSLNIPTKGLLKKSLLLVFLVSAILTVGYFILPELAISLLFGEAYFSIAPFLWMFGLAMSLFSLIYVLSLYNLSVNRTGFVYFILLFLALETGLIYFFHSSLEQILIVLNTVFIILLTAISIYTLKYEKLNNNNPST